MTDPLFDIASRTIVVTGGAGLLGREFSVALAQRGARVAIVERAEAGGAVRREIAERSPQGSVVFVDADVRDRAALQSALATVTQEWPPPSGLVNCAALDSPPDSPAEENGPFETYPVRSWDQVLDVNVKGVMLACQVIGGAMARHGRGSIVNIGSIYGLVSPDQRVYEYRRQAGPPFFKPVAYSASKSALYGLTRYLATYWAPQGVRVNALTFGGVYNRQDADFLKAYCARVPLGRMARPDEYNGALVFLLSDASSYVTGANVVVDGGWTAW